MGDVQLMTSNYWMTGRDSALKPRLGAISRGIPKKPEPWAGKVYQDLAPSWQLLKDTEVVAKEHGEDESIRFYTERFNDQLRRLNPDRVLKDVGRTAILLCYENVHKGEFCHRRLVAAWLEQRLGIQVPELPYPTVSVAPVEAPRPAPQLDLFGGGGKR